MWIRQVCVVGADVALDPEEELVTCPACLAGAPYMSANDVEDLVVTFVTECEVCENTHKVSRRLARALWEHQEATA